MNILIFERMILIYQQHNNSHFNQKLFGWWATILCSKKVLNFEDVFFVE